MKKLIVLLIIAMLLYGCSDAPKPTALPTAINPKSTQKPLIEIPSPSPSPKVVMQPLKIISGPLVNMSNLTVKIYWSTDKNSNTVLEWGTTDKYGYTNATNENATLHVVQITGLEYLTTYFYRADSCTLLSCAKSAQLNFTTGHKGCLPNMKYIADGDFCMDTFEASIRDGLPVSTGGVMPVSLISRKASQDACAAAGKRLCTSSEFTSACNAHGVKIGQIGDAGECNLNGSSPLLTGIMSNCSTDAGVHDLIGNLWEWVADSVTDKTPFTTGLVDRDNILTAGKDYQLPKQVNYKTELRGNDYYYNLEVFQPNFIGEGIAVGGAFATMTRGGCNAYMVGVPLDGAIDIGFRCCSD